MIFFRKTSQVKLKIDCNEVQHSTMAPIPRKEARPASQEEPDADHEVMESGEPRHTQPGSITRLKFINFMQYTETEFQCGPNLNVIIGPNGSGKSR